MYTREIDDLRKAFAAGCDRRDPLAVEAFGEIIHQIQSLGHDPWSGDYDDDPDPDAVEEDEGDEEEWLN